MGVYVDVGPPAAMTCKVLIGVFLAKGRTEEECGGADWLSVLSLGAEEREREREREVGSTCLSRWILQR
jgi:hypothetical protein